MSRTAVVLVNYKGAEDTRACLRSLRESSGAPAVVVVDNTPRDPGLGAALEGFADVHLISAPENLGFGGGNNLGIQWALSRTDCEFLFILNNDTTVMPDTIPRLEAALDAHPEAGMATPRIVLTEEPSKLWYGGGEVSWLRGSAIAPGYMGLSSAPLAMRERNVSFASGCAMLFRRGVLQRLGGFDDRFFMYEEDVEICLRTAEMGFTIRYVPEALVLHVVQASSRAEGLFVDRLSPLNPNLPFYVFHSVRNRLINVRLHADWKNRLLFSAGFSLFFAKKAFSYALRGRWDGVAAFFKGWRSYRACRIPRRVSGA